MRTSPFGSRLVAGAALLVPAVVLATVFGAGAQAETGDPAPGGTASPTATPSPDASPSASASPAPANPPAAPKPDVPKKAGEPEFDGVLTLAGPDRFAPGKIEKLTFTVTGTKATTYRVNLRDGRGLEIVKTDGHGDWRIGVPSTHALTATTSENSTAPSPIDVYVRAIDGPARSAVIESELLTNLPDPDETNNRVTKKFTVDGAGTVRGRAWHDKDRNGLQGGEPGVPNVPVALFSLADPEKPEFVADAETDAEGRYLFPHHPVGDYFVAVVAPEGGWDFTKPKVGTDEYQDSDVFTELEEAAALRAAAKRGLAAQLEDDEELILAFSEPITLDGKADAVVDAGLVKGAVPSPSTSPTVSATPAPGGGGSLPTTGAALTGLLGAGVLLLGGGIGITVLARRRRSAPGTA